MLNLQDVLDRLAQFKNEQNIEGIKHDLDREYENSIVSIQEFLYEVIDEYKKSVTDLENSGLHPLMMEQIEVLASLLESVENIDATVRTIDHDVILYVEFKDTKFSVPEAKLTKYDDLSAILKSKINIRRSKLNGSSYKGKLEEYFEQNPADYYRGYHKLMDVVADGRVVHRGTEDSMSNTPQVRLHDIVSLLTKRFTKATGEEVSTVGGIDLSDSTSARLNTVIEAHERYLPNRVVFSISLLRGELEVVSLPKLALAELYCVTGQMPYVLSEYQHALCVEAVRLTNFMPSGSPSITGDSQREKKTRDSAATLEYFAMCEERGEPVATIIDDMMGFVGFFSDNFSNNTGFRVGGRATGALHPHIGPSGAFCYGSIASDLSIMLTEFNYMGLVLLMYEFLKTTNMNDSAGRKVERFPTESMSGSDYTNLVHSGDEILTINNQLILKNVTTGDRMSVAEIVNDLEQEPDTGPLEEEEVRKKLQEILDDSHGVRTDKYPTRKYIEITNNGFDDVFADTIFLGEDMLPEDDAQWHFLHGTLFKVSPESDLDVDVINEYLNTHNVYKELDSKHCLKQGVESVVLNIVELLADWYEDMWKIVSTPDNVFGIEVTRAPVDGETDTDETNRIQIERSYTAAYDYLVGRLEGVNSRLNNRKSRMSSIPLKKVNETIRTCTEHIMGYFTRDAVIKQQYTQDFKELMNQKGLPVSARYLVGGEGESRAYELEAIGATINDVSNLAMPEYTKNAVSLTDYKRYFMAYMHEAVPQTHMIAEGQSIYYLTELALLDLLKTGTTNRVLNSFSYSDLGCEREAFTYEAFRLEELPIGVFKTQYKMTILADDKVFYASPALRTFDGVENLENIIKTGLQSTIIDMLDYYTHTLEGGVNGLLDTIVLPLVEEIMSEPYVAPFKGKLEQISYSPIHLFNRLNHKALTDEELMPYADKVHGADIDLIRMDDGEITDILKLVLLRRGTLHGHTQMSVLYDDKVIGHILGYTPIEVPSSSTNSGVGRGGLHARGTAMIHNTEIPQLFTQYVGNSAGEYRVDESINILEQIRLVFDSVGLDTSEIVYMRNEYMRYKAMQRVGETRNTCTVFAPTALPMIGFETSAIIQRFMTMYQLPLPMKSILDNGMRVFTEALQLDSAFTLGRGTTKSSYGLDGEYSRVRDMLADAPYQNMPNNYMPFFTQVTVLSSNSPRVHAPVLLSMHARGSGIAKNKKEALIELQNDIRTNGFSVVGFEPFRHEHFLLKELEEANS